MDDYKFKIKGMNNLLTYDQLVEVGTRAHPRCVKVVDMKQKKSWVTDLSTIMKKFG